MLKKGIRIFTIILVLFMLGMCGRKADKNSLAVNQKKVLEHYRELLLNLHDKGEFWDGEVVPLESDFGSIEENLYAIYDVDLDGRDELIVVYDTNCVANQFEAVYDFGDIKKELQREFGYATHARFYDNGVVCVDISHNQGVAGRFWPFFVYMYDKKTDSYKEAVFVDAWDKEYAPLNNYTGEEFPEHVDKDGNGMIYYINERSTDDSEDGVEAEAIDDAAYQKWWESLMDGAGEMEIPFVNLTTENIKRKECVKDTETAKQGQAGFEY